MSEIQKTNICCLDLPEECIDYLKSLDLNVYEGSLGSVFSINWGRNNYGSKSLLIDVNYPANLHEYHIFIHDMENPNKREYLIEEHRIKDVESSEERHLECYYPVNVLDIRPFGLLRLSQRLRDISNHARIEIIFIGRENEVTYHSNVIGGHDHQVVGTISNIEGWHLTSGTEKCGERVKLEENGLSKILFEGRIKQVKYYRVFTLPTEIKDEKRVIDNRYIPLLSNESGECISYLYYHSEEYIKIVLPQVEDKAGLLKDLFENILFKFCSDFFPDIEARSWINNETYLLPEELAIQDKIEAKREELQREIEKLKKEENAIREKNLYLKQMLTETGGLLVSSVKTFMEWLGFEKVTDKDETLKEGEIREEDLFFDYNGTHIIVEVKGIGGTSTDAECSQIDKIVNRRMRQLNTTDVHGIYIVNNQKNIEPLKRTIPPFNETQIKDAVGQSRTMVYTTQLFAIFSDIENGFITKEYARNCFMRPGLADFHAGLVSLGKPYSYYQNDTVVCLELDGVRIKIGDRLFYKDSLQQLIGLTVKELQQDGKDCLEVSSGKTGLKLDNKVPRNKSIYIAKQQ